MGNAGRNGGEYYTPRPLSLERIWKVDYPLSELEKARKAAKKKQPMGQVPKAKPITSAAAGGLHFGPRKLSAAEAEVEKAQVANASAMQEAAKLDAELKEAKKAVRKAKKKFDPAQEAFARELKDRWLEEVAAQPGLLSPASARYDFSRGIDPSAGESVRLNNAEPLQLPDAA